MHIAQSLLGDIRAAGVQQFHVVAEVAHQPADQAKLDRQHIWH